MDTSIHDWLEGRGESMVLVAMIDDATGRIEAGFYSGETVEAHFDLLGRWLRKNGRPMALYTDRDSIFEPAGKHQPDPEGQTQFGRALEELDIERITAYSPQAKGRVERLFDTLQDRWVKELRLAKVTTMAQANVVASQADPRIQSSFQRRRGPASGCTSRPRRGTLLAAHPVRTASAQREQRLHRAFPKPHLPTASARLARPTRRQSDDRATGRRQTVDPLRRPLSQLPGDPGAGTSRCKGRRPGGLCPSDPPEFTAFTADA